MVPFVVVCLIGQQQPVKPRTAPVNVMGDKRPVTCEESYRVFTDARKILNKSLGAHLPACTLPQTSKVVTKEQVVAEMTAINRGMTSFVKFTLPAEPFSKSLLHIDPSEMADLQKLIRNGYVTKVSSLATSQSDSLTVVELGKTLGFFLSRTAEITHLPTAKWSPNLGAGS